MKTIWKFILDIAEEQIIDMPYGAKILATHVQGPSIVIWAEVNTNAILEKRKFFIYGTGHEYEKLNGIYLGTCQISGFVWHVYDGGLV